MQQVALTKGISEEGLQYTQIKSIYSPSITITSVKCSLFECTYLSPPSYLINYKASWVIKASHQHLSIANHFQSGVELITELHRAIHNNASCESCVMGFLVHVLLPVPWASPCVMSYSLS